MIVARCGLLLRLQNKLRPQQLRRHHRRLPLLHRRPRHLAEGQQQQQGLMPSLGLA
jgi:hypothetical protein